MKDNAWVIALETQDVPFQICDIGSHWPNDLTRAIIVMITNIWGPSDGKVI